MHKQTDSNNQDNSLKAYKNAGARASTYLLEQRGLQLTSSERLELVARVLNVANWQTLRGLAQQGRVASLQVPEQALEMTGRDDIAVGEIYIDSPYVFAAKELHAYYGDKDHPRYLREHWAYEATEGDTKLNYWTWVLHKIESDGGMLPWEADETESVIRCRLAGWTAAYEEMPDDATFPEAWVVRDAHGLMQSDNVSEESAWEEACNALSSRVRAHFKLSDGKWYAMENRQQRQLVRDMVASIPR